MTAYAHQLQMRKGIGLFIKEGWLGLLMGAIIVATALADSVAFSTCLYLYAIISLFRKDRLLNLGTYFTIAFAVAIWLMVDWQAVSLFLLSLSLTTIRYSILLKCSS
jgi:hypothetical protein